MAPHDDHDHDHGHDHDHAHGHPHHHPAPPLRLQAARIYCGDLEQAVLFYRDLIGLTLLKQAGNAAVFDTGVAQLTVEGLPHGHPAHADMVGRFTGLSFVVADLAATYGRLSALGVTFLAPPQPQAAGGGAAHFRDTAGNVLTMIGKL